MRKLAFLVMILALVPCAKASIVLDWDSTTLSMATDSSGYTSDDYWVLACRTADAIIGPATIVPNSYYDFTDQEWSQGEIGGRMGLIATLVPSPPGNILLANFTPTITNATTVYLYRLNGDTGELDTLWDTKFIPEPMTIALLGIGGLFLRRRK